MGGSEHVHAIASLRGRTPTPAGDGVSLSRRVRVVLASQLVMSTSTFMATPFLTVYLTRNLRLDPVQVGTTLTILLASGRVLPLATGALADRFGYRLAMVGGVALRSAGFAALSLTTQPTEVAGAALLIGVGGALYDPAASGAMAVGDPRTRPRVFAVRNQVLNVSVIAGPMIGAGLLAFGARTPFLVAAACFAALAFVLHRAGALEGERHIETDARAGYRLALRDRSFLAFCAVMVLWWVVFAQLNVALPLRIAALGGGERWVSVLFVVNGVAGLVTLVLIRGLLTGLAPQRLLCAGYLVTGAGMALVAVVPSAWWTLGCVAVYTVGETLLLPGADLAVAAFASERAAATFFGIFALSWAVGGTVGNYLGSWLSASAGPTAPWLVYGAIAAAGAITVSRLRFPASAPA
jgi:MFS family permease